MIERVYRLTAPLACLHEAEDLPAGTLAMEPRTVAGTTILLASTDGGETWREVATVFDGDLWDWFEPFANDAAQ